MKTIKQLKDTFISDTASIIKDVHKFNSLSENQINWKPNADRWSIAECIDHLFVTNKLYLVEMENQFRVERIKADCSLTPVKHNFMSRFIIKGVDPANTKKTKTFKVFLPSRSNHGKNIFNDFIDLQNKFINLISSYKDLNLNKYKMSSPAARFIKENFSDVLEIIRLHDRRHLNQAQNIINNSNFPKN